MSLGRAWLLACVAVLLGAAATWGQAGLGVDVLQQLDLTTITVSNGDGRPETTQVTLTLSAPAAEEVALDLVLVVDRSATTDIGFVQEIGESFLEALPSNGRIALVSFAEEAALDVELTASTQLFRDGLDRLRNIGKTAVGDGMFEATQHLLQRGRSDALWLEVLITDGRANAGRDPRLQGQRAADNGVQIVTIGLGRNPDENLLREIASATGGSFFREFSLAAVEEVYDRTHFTFSASDLSIVETLAPGIVYEQGLFNPPSRVSATTLGTRLEWSLGALEAGEQWSSIFAISATREGFYLVNQAPSELTFTNFRRQRITQPLPLLQLNVLPPLPPNQPAVVKFSFTPDAPSTQRDVQFSNESSDADGHIVSYFWDFGDGATSVLENPSHRYAQDGTYTVTLTVSDDRGDAQSLSRTLTVETKMVNVARTIETFLPTDVILKGETFRVTLYVEINASLNGMGVEETINETIPDGWIITPVNNAGARFKQLDTPKKLQWLFLEVLGPGEVREISYEVKVPGSQTPGIFLFKGVTTSASPTIEIKASGEAQVEVKDSLPIETIVSRWDPLGGSDQQGALNLKLSNTISFDQVQVAVGWWLNNDSVPFSGSKRIDFATIQSVIARWLTNTPITEPLPGSKG